MKRVRLNFKGVSEIVGTEEVGLLILLDEGEQNQLSITCDRLMLEQFMVRMSHVPVSDKMLPEILWQTIRTIGNFHFEIIVNDIVDGQYKVFLRNVDTRDEIYMRASDAVLLSYISDVPIYIDAKLMSQQSVPYRKEAKGLSLPVNSLTDEMIVSALDKAIHNEDYELASSLRDEIQRRKKQKEDMDEGKDTTK
jgi:bifunctional DNase/RNase